MTTETSPPDTTVPAAGAVVPEKPTLDGLEEKWVALGGRGHLRLRPAAALPRDQIFSIDTPPPTGQRLAARRPRLQLHPHRLRRPLPADARPATSSTRWAGTTTACPPSAGCRTTTACAATRRCPTTPTFTPPEKPGKEQIADLAAQLRRAVRAADRARTSSAFEELWRRLGPVGRLVRRLHAPSATPRAPPPSGRSCATWPAARPTRPRRPTLWDVNFRTAVAQAELEDRERPGAYHRIAFHRPRRRRRAHRDHPARAAPGLRRAGRPPRRRALPAAVRHDGAHAAVRRRGAGRRPPPGRAGQGLGHRDDLHLRRPHRRHLVARAAAADRGRSSAGTAGSCADAARLASSRRRSRYAELAGKTVNQAQQRIVELLRESGDLRRRAEADHAPGEVLREGRARRSRSSPPASGTSATAAATPTCATRCSPAAAELELAPRRTCGTATTTGSRASTATG